MPLPASKSDIRRVSDLAYARLQHGYDESLLTAIEKKVGKLAFTHPEAQESDRFLGLGARRPVGCGAHPVDDEPGATLARCRRAGTVRWGLRAGYYVCGGSAKQRRWTGVTEEAGA